ncbi:MAG: CarD family transcriptional regulator [Clostridiales bacterium]|nr:CarD family transcriptional regulator [Clostridiales bacterium]
MFTIGDKVVYPVHGAGVIEAIETRAVLGELKNYYVLRIRANDMKVMVPVEAIEGAGVRSVIKAEAVEEVLAVLRLGGPESGFCENWTKRYRSNMEKIKSGDICRVAEVVRGLTLRHLAKGLSSGERRMLDYARQILISELTLAQEREEKTVALMIDELFVKSPDDGDMAALVRT